MPDAEQQRSAPPWVITFADLMTLLMCFFVLMLAFSEQDAARFKVLSGSIRDAFGVQAVLDARTLPKGTSVIAREFSPGVPDPTALAVINQHTQDSNLNTLDVIERRELLDETRKQADRLRAALAAEIANGSIAIETEGVKIIIRILENPSFDSGYADVRPEFLPVLERIGRLIDLDDGTVTVSGHTDDVPISNERFRSNWELSASRAVSVAHVLLESSGLDPGRLVVSGHADTRPRAPNDTPENRAKNRRVDISIVRGDQLDTNRMISVDDARAGIVTAGESGHEH